MFSKLDDVGKLNLLQIIRKNYREEFFMKKQLIYLTVGTLLTIGLAACSNDTKQSQPKSSSSQKTSQLKKVSHKAKSSKQVSNTSQSAQQATTKEVQADLWDQTKAKQLDTFMTNWGYSMQQKYHSYSPQNPGKFNGIALPMGFYTNGTHPLALNEGSNKQPTAWADTGVGASNTYNIVACYAYQDELTEMDRYTYLFTFYNGKPVALVTGQSEANNYGTTVFKPTANPDVTAAFEQIAAGKGVPAKFAQTPTAAKKVEADTPVTEDIALRVYWAAKKAENADFGITNITHLFFENVSNMHAYDNENVRATFPNNTYMVGQMRNAENDVAFQLIGNNRARVYYIRGSLSGLPGDPTENGNQIADKAMNNPKEVEIPVLPNNTMQALKECLQEYK